MSDCTVTGKLTASTLDERLSAFRTFLRVTWDALPLWLRTSEDGGRGLRDWFQTNWEVLVSCPLQHALYEDERYISWAQERCVQPYGEGAACNKDGRITSTGLQDTHEIRVNEGLRFYSFGTLHHDGFVQAPPFDYLKAVDINNESHVLRAEDAAFSVVRTEPFQAVLEEFEAARPLKPAPTSILEEVAIGLGVVIIPAILIGFLGYYIGMHLGKDYPALALGLFGGLSYLSGPTGETVVERFVPFSIIFLLMWLVYSILPDVVGEAGLTQLLIAALLGALLGLGFSLLLRIFIPDDHQ